MLGEARETACLDRTAPQHQPRALGETPRPANLPRACRGAFRSPSRSQDLELQTHLLPVEPVPGNFSFGISPLHFTMETCQGPRPPRSRRVHALTSRFNSDSPKASSKPLGFVTQIVNLNPAWGSWLVGKPSSDCLVTDLMIIESPSQSPSGCLVCVHSQ